MNKQMSSKIAIAAVLGLSALVSAGTVAVDATSGSSIKVVSATCTSNSMSINWTFNQGGGNWRFYYGTTNVAPPTVTGWATTVTPNGKSLTVSGLTAGTKYYATLAGWEGGVSSRAGSYAHMSFTTDGGVSAILDRTSVSPQPFAGYDASGRRLGRISSSAAMFSTQQGSQVRIQR